MKKSALICTYLAVMPATFLLGAALPVVPAHAFSATTYVASNGSDTTACPRATPCATIGFALSFTPDGGVLRCVDPLTNATHQGTVTITQSVTIDCLGVNASIARHGAVGFVINGAGINVTLRGLTITTPTSVNGFTPGTIGVNIMNAANVAIQDCAISGFTTSGIIFAPAAAGKLLVTDTILSNNGNGTTGGGIIVKSQAGGTAQVTLNRVIADKNVFGIVADGAGSAGGINMTVTDSVSSGNTQDGIIAVTPSGGAPIGVMVKNSKSVNNNIGIRSIGPNVTVRVSGSSVIGNSTALSFSAGGALLSFGNNDVAANGSNGAFNGSVGLQ